MKKMINSTHVEGLLYDHKLQRKVSGANSKHPGTEFISGELQVATNNAHTNIVPIHFTYVTATTAKGTENATYAILSDIIDGKLGTIMANGEDGADKVRVDSSIAVNDFYTDRNGEETLISAKRIENGFVHKTNKISEDEKQRSTFDTDILIVGVAHKDAVENDAGKITSPEKAVIDGRIFSYGGKILPVQFSAINPQAINYFEGLDASMKQPVFTHVKGQIISEQTVRQIVTESAFGAPDVREIPTNHKEYVITWAASETYDFGDEDVLTFDDLARMGAERETYLATVKTRNEEYKAARANAGGTSFTKPATASANTKKAPAAGEYNF